MNRYQSSFLITSTFYAVVGFFVFFTFTNTFTIPNKTPQKITTISLSKVEVSKAPLKPIIEKKPTPIKKPQEPEKLHKVIEEEVVENDFIEQPVKSVSTAQMQNLEHSYLSKVQEKVEKYKEYPKNAERLHQTGKVEVSFDILKSGHIQNVKIVKNSKFEKLDEATLKLLLKIAAFDPIPDDLDRTVWNITIPVAYDIQYQ